MIITHAFNINSHNPSLEDGGNYTYSPTKLEFEEFELGI